MERFKSFDFKAGILISVIGMALLIGGFLGMRSEQWKKARCSAEAKALVTSAIKASERTSSGKWARTDFIKAEFYVNEIKYLAEAKEHRSKNASPEPRFKEGTWITVMYNPSEPSENYIKAAKEYDHSKTMLSGGIIFIAGLAEIVRSFRKKAEKDYY